MLASYIAEKIGYEFVGKDSEITGIAFYHEASETDIAVVFNQDEINRTKAKVVLTEPVLIPTEKTLILSHDSIGLSTVKICDILIDYNILINYNEPVNFNLSAKGYYIGNHCNISKNAIIYPGAVIGNYVYIGDNCVIDSSAVIGSGTVISNDVYIGSGSKVGAESFYHYYDAENCLKQFQGCGKAVIKSGTHIGSNTVIERGTISDTVIGSNCIIGNNIDIGHDVKIGKNCKIVSQTGIAGGAILKDNVLVYGQVGISNNVVVGNNAIIKGKTAVSKSVKDNDVVYGFFGRNYNNEMKLITKIRKYFE